MNIFRNYSLRRLYYYYITMCIALQAIAKHIDIENYSFYKSSLSPISDAIKYSWRRIPEFRGSSRRLGSSIIQIFSFVVIIDKIYLFSDFVFDWTVVHKINDQYFLSLRWNHKLNDKILFYLNLKLTAISANIKVLQWQTSPNFKNFRKRKFFFFEREYTQK